MKLNVINRSVFFGLTALLLSSTTNAQQGENLLSNGGFEATDGKVKKLGGIASATGWNSVTGVPADLFTDSKIIDINVPANKFGKESPKEGGNYAGFEPNIFSNYKNQSQ